MGALGWDRRGPLVNAKAERLLAVFDGLPRGSVFVEIGCVRFPEEIASDGYSTVYLAEAAKENGWELHSIDIDAAAVQNAQALTENLPNAVHHADGAAWLKEFRGSIGGLYLDGAAQPQQAVDQYRAARLSDDAVIAIDDIQPIAAGDVERLERGKGDLLLDVLAADGWTVDIHKTIPGYLMAVATR